MKVLVCVRSAPTRSSPWAPPPPTSIFLPILGRYSKGAGNRCAPPPLGQRLNEQNERTNDLPLPRLVGFAENIYLNPHPPRTVLLIAVYKMSAIGVTKRGCGFKYIFSAKPTRRGRGRSFVCSFCSFSRCPRGGGAH